MQLLKTLIIDDEQGHIDMLRSILLTYQSIFIEENIFSLNSASEARTRILNGDKFDLVILDKYLDNGVTCFDLLQLDSKFFKILALNSIDTEAEKYFKELKIVGNWLVLHKPYNEDDVAQFVIELKEKLAELQQTKPLFIKDKGIERKIPQEHIVYIEIVDYTCFIHISWADGSREKLITTNKSLTEYERILSKEMFCRISKSVVINKNFVRGNLPSEVQLWEKDEKTNKFITLNIHLSYRDEFREFIKSH